MDIHNQTQFILINKDEAGQRIDNFLFAYLRGIPDDKIYHIIRNGEVRINSSRIKPKYKIKASDLIRIPPLRQIKKQKNVTSIPFDKSLVLSSRIIYEDEYLLILNKPSGIAVHGGSGINFGVIEILRLMRPKVYFLELVHRMDRETSGVLLIAKKRSVLKALHQQLRLRQIYKQYYALVKGQWPSMIKVIQAPLLKNILKNGKRLVKVDNNGKFSETHFTIKERFSNATLLEVNLVTGRTHQIRVHAQYINHPIACDKRYGDSYFNKQLTATNLNRLFLHAKLLVFIHPRHEKKIAFRAPLDIELQNCLMSLRNK